MAQTGPKNEESEDKSGKALKGHANPGMEKMMDKLVKDIPDLSPVDSMGHFYDITSARFGFGKGRGRKK